MVCNANPNFNSHAHVERDYSGFATGTNYQDFNSHAHVERDTAVSQLAQTTKISTHTLTWSVTCSKMISHLFTKMISTHTLTWSVTIHELQILRRLIISTHTLTWSVTCGLATV